MAVTPPPTGSTRPPRTCRRALHGPLNLAPASPLRPPSSPEASRRSHPVCGKDAQLAPRRERNDLSPSTRISWANLPGEQILYELRKILCSRLTSSLSSRSLFQKSQPRSTKAHRAVKNGERAPLFKDPRVPWTPPDHPGPLALSDCSGALSRVRSQKRFPSLLYFDILLMKSRSCDPPEPAPPLGSLANSALLHASNCLTVTGLAL